MCLKLIKIESLDVFFSHFDSQLKSNFLCILDDFIFVLSFNSLDTYEHVNKNKSTCICPFS